MLSGTAGSGKSTIARSVASILAEDKHTLVASFFFSRDYVDRKEIRHVPSTLAHQLADYNPQFRYLLVNFLDADRTGILSADPHVQFQRLVVELLAQLPPSQTTWVICIDALDECGRDRGQLFLRWLSDSITQIPAYIRFFLTGRPDVPSYLKFDTLQSLMHGISLDEIDSVLVSQDIHLYVNKSLDGSTWTTRDPWKIHGCDADMITSRAAGLFVFAATAVHYVLSGLPQNPPQESIDYLLKGGVPLIGLHELYQHIVNEAIIIPHADDLRGQDTHHRTMQILRTILALYEPLNAQSLAAILQMKVESLIRVLIPLSAVIHIPSNSNGTIQIRHLSFREFMISKVQEQRPDLLCGAEDPQACLALNLLQVMQNELRFNICNLPTSYLRNNEMPDLEKWLNTFVPAHLRYACRFWMDHLSAAPCTTEFLKPVLSLLGKVSYASQALSKFILWIKEDSDAKRFIAFFSDAISQTPVESHVAKTFRPQFPQLLGFKRVGVLEGHTDRVTSHIVSGSSDNTIRVWDVESGEALGEPFMGHTESVSSHIVSGSDDKTIRVWDVESGKALGEPFIGHTESVRSVTFSPDGQRIVSGSGDKTIHVWDVESGEVLGEPFMGHTESVHSVAFSPDGQHIVSGSGDKTIRVWDVESGEALGKPFVGHTESVRSVVFSPNGQRIVSGSHDKTIHMWDVESGEALGEPFTGHAYWVCSVAFSPDGQCIVSGSGDKTIRVWDVESGKALGEPFTGHTDWVTSVALSPDGQHIVSGCCDTTIRVWDVESEAALEDSFMGHTESVESVAFSPDGRSIVSGSHDTTIRVWDVDSGEALGEPFMEHIDSVRSVAFSPDGQRIVSGSFDKTICVWDVETGEALGEPFIGHTDWVMSVTFSPDGQCIVSGSRDKTIRVWDVESREALGEPFIGHTEGISSVAFSPDGRYIVSGSFDKTICVWDVESGKALGEPFMGHTEGVSSVAFSPDGQCIVSGSRDKTMCVWDVESGEALREPFMGHTDGISSVAFSPDGRCIVSGSFDKTIRVWDVESGAALGEPFMGHTESVCSVAFSPNGQYIVSGSFDRTIRVWDIVHVKWHPNREPVHCPLPYNTNLLFWLPSTHRMGFWMPHNTLILGQQQTLLSYDNLAHGSEWAECIVPISGTQSTQFIS
ncbi:WD40 repeat-like protein [Mycena maculata]|uniref:WD40 repeat-like protein n=1 Tax=Mycena maculata TaxID=230809 RepID=A0AAD7KH39_9AGAR|nr:WD40 repeat-like protein [Mycena maculata]